MTGLRVFDTVEVLRALADRLERKYVAMSGDSDLDETASDRSEAIGVVADEVRALADELEHQAQSLPHVRLEAR